MKVNISVDLDWLDESGDINDIMKDELISGVKSAISRQCLDKVQADSSKAIDGAIKTAVDESVALIQRKVSDFVEEWMRTEVVITDKYGDPTQRGSIRDLVKLQFDGLMNSFVNSDGKLVTKDSYGSKMSVVRFLTGEAVREVVDSELRQYKTDIDKKIKEEINNGIKRNVSDLFAQMVVNTAQQRHAEQMAIESK